MYEVARSWNALRERALIDADFAQRFVQTWLQAWNDHDLDAVLALYAEDAALHSPRFNTVLGAEADIVCGHAELRRYWARALELSGDLFFAIDKVFIGSDALTVAYINHRQQEVAETFIFGANGKVRESVTAYAG